MTTLHGCHVLLVDDDPDTLDMHRFVLHQFGARLTLARDAEEALAVLGAAPVDVLLTDLSLPGLDGFALLAEVRRLGHTLPALAVSAHGAREVKKRALAAGFLDCLSKPLAPMELVAAARSSCAAAGALAGDPGAVPVA